MAKRSDFAGAGIVFLCAAALFWWLAGHRLIPISDEGLYLDGARRLLAGQALYRDFFVLTGPGTFWNVAAFFRIFGVSLASARALLVCDLTVIATGIYWLATRFHSRALGFWLASFFAALLVGDSGRLVVDHRWDSAACLMMSALLLRSGRWWQIGLAGVAAGYAAWITPPILLALAPMFAWSFFERRWAGVFCFGSGIAAVSAGATGALFATGSFGPFVHHFAWIASQYSGANRFAYGGIIGGYGPLFSDAHGLELWIRVFLVFFIALPAIAPILAVVTVAAARRVWNKPMVALLACAIASVVACAPRLDVTHLMYASPLNYVVAACALASILPPRLRMALVMALSLGAGMFLWNGISQRRRLEMAKTREGVVVGEHGDLSLDLELEAVVRPGESFFAFPYVPLAYFLTQGRNPTRYSYLQPGMMSNADENTALGALIQSPPGKVLYIDVPVEAYLRMFPSSDPKRLRMQKIEDWLRANYEKDEEFRRRHPGYDLLTLHQPAAGFVAQTR